MQSHICCICLAFLHCGFPNISSDCLPYLMQSRIGCICLVFLRCVFSNFSSNCLPQLMQSHIDCTRLTLLHWSLSFGPYLGLPVLVGLSCQTESNHNESWQSSSTFWKCSTGPKNEERDQRLSLDHSECMIKAYMIEKLCYNQGGQCWYTWISRFPTYRLPTKGAILRWGILRFTSGSCHWYHGSISDKKCAKL